MSSSSHSSSIVVRAVPIDRLDEQALLAWDGFQQGNEELASPFFRPEFAQIVSAAKGGVEVAIVEGRAGPLAFLPFQRGRRGRGLPVGSRLSDYQGVVAPRGASVDLREIVRGAGLQVIELDGLLASQATRSPDRWVSRSSPFLDLSAGFDAYADARRESGSKQVEDVLKQRRRLEEHAGPLRFEVHSAGPEALETLLGWKSDQYRRTGAVDIFSYPWVVDSVRRVQAASSSAFAGLLSTLRAGERLVAAHLGMRSSSVWHYWLPAYDPTYARHSPGLVLLLEMARAAADLGVRSIDLGKGDALYKRRLASSSAPLVAGTISASALGTALGAGERLVFRFLHRTPLSAPARRLAMRRRLT